MGKKKIIQDRIKELRRVKASELVENDKNWRVHTDYQKKVMEGVLQDIGYASALIAREDQDGRLHLIDGHMRANVSPDTVVPVLILDVTEEEADKLLALFDPITEMAETDYQKLNDLLSDVQTEDNSVLEYIADQQSYLQNWILNDEEPDEEEDEEEEEDDEDDDLGPVAPSTAVTERPLQDYHLLFENGRTRTANLYHFLKFDPARADGFYQIPTIAPTNFIPKRMIDFDEVLRCQDKNNWTVHFFEYDSKFERFWRDPEKYIEILKPFGSMIAPDFSIYVQMSRANMIWNVYRSHLLSQMCQDAGIEVIPRIRFLDPSTYDFTFAGVPQGGTVCMSTIGFAGYEDMLPMYHQGMEEMFKRIQPSHLVIYGKIIEADYHDVPITHFKNTSDTYRRGISDVSEDIPEA